MAITDATRMLEGVHAMAARMERVPVAAAVDGSVEPEIHALGPLRLRDRGPAVVDAQYAAAHLVDAGNSMTVPQADGALRAARAAVEGLGARLGHLDELTATSYWEPGGDARRVAATSELSAVRAGLAHALQPDHVAALPEVVGDDLQRIRSRLAMVQVDSDLAAPSGGWNGVRALATGLDRHLATLTPQHVVAGAMDPALNPNAAAVADTLATAAARTSTRDLPTRTAVARIAREAASVNCMLDRQLSRVAELPTTRAQVAPGIEQLRSVVAADAERLRALRDGGNLDPVIAAATSRVVDGDELAVHAAAAGSADRLPTFRGRAVTDQLEQLGDLAEALPSGVHDGAASLTRARAAAAPVLAAGAAPDRATAARRLRIAADLLSATATADREIPRALGGVDAGRIGVGTQMALRRSAAADAAALVRQAAATRPPLPDTMRRDTRVLARTLDRLAIDGHGNVPVRYRTRAGSLRSLASSLERLPEPAPATAASLAATRQEIAAVRAELDSMRDVSSDYQRIAEALPRWQQVLTRIDGIVASLPPDLPAEVRDPLLDRIDRFSDQVARAQSSFDYGAAKLDEALFPKQALLGAIEADLRLLDNVTEQLMPSESI